MTIEIKQVTSQQEIIEQIDLFKKLPGTIESWETLFAQCLTGNYTTWFGYEDDKVIGLAFFKISNLNAHIGGVIGIHQVNKFRDLFFEKLKSIGLKTITANSKLPEKSYMRLMDLDKKLYSVYSKEL